MERMSEEQMSKKVYMSEVKVTRKREETKEEVEVKNAVKAKGLNVQEGARHARDRANWNCAISGDEVLLIG